MLLKCFAVGLGGFLGATMRYLLSLIPIATAFPLMTLIINTIGGLAIGVIYALTGHLSNVPTTWLLFLQVGICGGFTTFSTFSLENLQLLENGKTGLMILYAVASVALCLIAVWLGKHITTTLLNN